MLLTPDAIEAIRARAHHEFVHRMKQKSGRLNAADVLAILDSHEEMRRIFEPLTEEEAATTKKLEDDRVEAINERDTARCERDTARRERAQSDADLEQARQLLNLCGLTLYRVNSGLPWWWPYLRPFRFRRNTRGIEQEALKVLKTVNALLAKKEHP